MAALAASASLVQRPKPQVAVNIVKGHFTIKTVTSRREYLQVLRLRYDVFHREYRGRKFPFGIDTDRWDAFADHLIIVDHRSRRVVGTYRMIPSTKSLNFYSASEFDVSAILALPGIKLELSRACIAPEWRSGAVISLLWRGVVAYSQQVGADWLFGMGSVKSTLSSDILKVYQDLETMGAVAPDLDVQPVGVYRRQEIVVGVNELRAQSRRSPGASEREEEQSGELFPALLRSYLRAGARVCGYPAVDLEFNCADFFTLLDLSKVSGAYGRKFLK
jgi:putative hemolysin